MIEPPTAWYSCRGAAWPSLRTRILFIGLAFAVYPLIVYGALAAWNNSHTRVLDWLPTNQPETQTLFTFVERFGADELLVVGWDGMDLEDPRAQQLVSRLLQPDVPRTATPYFDQVWSGGDMLQWLTSPPLDISVPHAKARMRGWMLGAEDRTVVVAKVSSVGMNNRHAAVRFVRTVAEELSGLPSEAIHIAGPTVESVFIDEVNQKTLLELNGFSLLACYVLLLLTVRRWYVATVIFVIAVFGQQLTMAMIHFTGGHMDSVVMLTASLTMVLCLSACIHMYGYYRLARESGQTTDLAGTALREAILPTFWAVLTTSLGLASLLVSELQPIFDFGLYGAIAVPLTTLIGMWYLAMYLPARSANAGKDTATKVVATKSPLPTVPQELSAGVPNWTMRHWPIVFGITLLLWLLGSIGLPRLQANVGINNLLDPDAKILQDYRWLESHVGPIVPVELVLTIPNDAGLTLVEQLGAVAGLQKAVRQCDAVGLAVSPLNFLPEIPPWGGRQTMGQIAQARVLERRLTEALPELKTSRMLYTDGQANRWRITAKVQGSRDQNYEKLMADLTAAGNQTLSQLNIPGGDVLVSGGVPVVVKTQMRLLSDLVVSFLLALLLIYLALLAMLRNPWAALLALLPNALPAVLVFGGLGWLGIKAELGGVMTASVALGIAVDDTLHLLHQFHQALASGMQRRAAVIAAYRRCRRSIVQTSLVIAGGMFVFAFSSFVPVSRFAWLLLLMLGVALVANLGLMTAILYSPLGQCFCRPWWGNRVANHANQVDDLEPHKLVPPAV